MNMHDGLEFARMIYEYVSAEDEASALRIADGIICNLSDHIDECAEHGGWYGAFERALDGEEV